MQADSQGDNRSVIGHEIYSVIGICGAQEFAKDQKLINILIEIKYFNLLSNQTHSLSLPNPVLRKYFLAELFGYFELFETLMNAESAHHKNSILTHNSLADGFRDTLTLMVRSRGEMDSMTLKNLLKIIYNIVMYDQNDIDYSQLIYDATLQVYRIEQSIRTGISQQSRTDTKVMKELQKIVVIRKGLNEVLVRSYTTPKRVPTPELERLAKINAHEFLNKLILELNEEEIKIKLVPEMQASEALTGFSLKSDREIGLDVDGGSIYKYLMRLIFETCVQKADPQFFSHVFDLIAQKYPIVRLIDNYVKVISPVLKEYYCQMLKLVGHMAGFSRCPKIMRKVVTQVFQALAHASIPETPIKTWARVLEASNDLLNTIYDDACKQDSDFVFDIYCLLTSVYSEMRGNDHPLDRKWVASNKFAMHWVEKCHRYLNQKLEYIPRLEKEGVKTLQFWQFVIIDIEELLTEKNGGFKEFSLTFNSLTEESQKNYSNSIMNYHMLVKERVDEVVEPKLRRVVHNYYKAYEK